MRIRIIGLALIIVMLAAAGCGAKNKQEEPEPGTDASVSQNQTEVDPDLITAENFVSSLQDWTIRLEAIGQKTSDAHSNWLNGKLDTEDYLITLQNLQKEIKALSLETDYKDYELSEQERESLAFEQITKGYNRCSKNLNDFLHSTHLPDEKIKERYNTLVEEGYKSELEQLKSNLKM
jgi:hypothetical protein